LAGAQDIKEHSFKTPTERKILDDSAVEATNTQRDAVRAAVAVNMELLKKNGMTITEFPPAELAKMRK
jgi:TRAP-type transport system periplasmic protein